MTDSVWRSQRDVSTYRVTRRVRDTYAGGASTYGLTVRGGSRGETPRVTGLESVTPCVVTHLRADAWRHQFGRLIIRSARPQLQPLVPAGQDRSFAMRGSGVRSAGRASGPATFSLRVRRFGRLSSVSPGQVDEQGIMSPLLDPAPSRHPCKGTRTLDPPQAHRPRPERILRAEPADSVTRHAPRQRGHEPCRRAAPPPPHEPHHSASAHGAVPTKTRTSYPQGETQ